MAISAKWATRVVLLLFLALFLSIGCKPDTPPNRTPQTGALASQPTSTASVSILPTPTINPEDIEPTIPPSPTFPPVPTPLPTPIVTPIPVASPPFIPEVVGKAQQPFWIYYWQGNEVWRVDDQGKDRQLVIDTYKTLGQYLTDIPDPYKDSDCCWIGPRVVISPDGNKLALVVVDKIKGTKNDQFTFSIYVLDVQTGNLKAIDKGLQPVWSPNNEQIAFLKGSGLWMADLKTQQARELVPEHNDPDMHVTEFVWSPDNSQVAYLYNFSMQRLSTVWVIGGDSGIKPRELFSLDDGYPIHGIAWSADGRRMFYLSFEGGRDTSSFHRVQNIWSVNLETGTRTQLTQEMVVDSYCISPDNQWLFFGGYHLYERGEENYERDVWLLNINGKDLRRITTNLGAVGSMCWSPDGTRLIVWRAELPPLLFSVENGSATVLNFDLGTDYQIGGVK
jgi:Tol biopolymer transport system component